MGGTFVSEPVAFISADDALALLRAAGHNAQRSPARGRCRTLCYLVGGQYVNLGRLRQLAAELSPAPAAPAEPVAAEPAPAPQPVAAEPVAAPEPLSPAAVVALLCRKFPVTTPATYQPAVARLQARGAAITPLSVLQELNRPAPAEPAAPVAAEPARPRPVLPGEAQPPAAPAPHGAAAPTLPAIRPQATAAELRAQAVELEAEALQALQALAEIPALASSAADIRSMYRQLTARAAELRAAAAARSAAALAALPPVTAAQDAALAACRTGAVPGRPYL